jgi:hypothetical protein
MIIEKATMAMKFGETYGLMVGVKVMRLEEML